MADKYSFTNDVSELSGWIRDEIEYKRDYSQNSHFGGLGVRRIQEWLYYHGYQLNPDGYFGPVTRANIEDFQDSNSLPKTGIVDKTTFELLVKPMRELLRRPNSAGINYREAILMHAQGFLAAHPVEIGTTNNYGMWVRLFMKGHEGDIYRWCAGFVSFITHLAAETLSITPPVSRHVSCDLLASEAISKGLFHRGSDLSVDEVKPGSIFLIRATENDWVHTGVVVDVDVSARKFETIEGNADHEGSPNGYEVCSISRGMENTDFVIFPQEEPVVFNASTISIKRYFYSGPNSYTYGSFFKYWDGWITAAHVIEQMDNQPPPFTYGEIDIRPDILDAALIGCTLPDVPPLQLYRGQKVAVRGFPGGSSHVSERLGEVYIERNFDDLPAGADVPGKSWIVKIDLPEEPVVVGMSGGLAMDADTGMPVGILITSNSRAQLDSDPEEDHSMDIVSLRDVYDALTAIS